MPMDFFELGGHTKKEIEWSATFSGKNADITMKSRRGDNKQEEKAVPRPA